MTNIFTRSVGILATFTFFGLSAAAQSTLDCDAFAEGNESIAQACDVMVAVFDERIDVLEERDLEQMAAAQRRAFSLDLGEGVEWRGDRFFGSFTIKALGRHQSSGDPCRRVNIHVREIDLSTRPLKASPSICLSSGDWQVYEEREILFLETETEEDNPNIDESLADVEFLSRQALEEMALADIRKPSDQRARPRMTSVRILRKHLFDKQLFIHAHDLADLIEPMFLPQNRLDTVILLARYTAYNRAGMETILERMILDENIIKARAILKKYLR